ncbi:leucine-rich repeat-containing protein 37A-like [Petaurus breviceps papuanus]|uniref:leucine-rich repeat-containing protein 37A-like n=1 Tax=Petaurus breviceps papuanus TaxID=3040969 RepID=UPI0036D8723E
MSGRPPPQLWLSVFLLLALAPRSPLSMLVLSRAQRVTPAIRHRTQPGVLARALPVIPDPAAVRAQVLRLGEVSTTASVLSRTLAVFSKVSDILALPKLTPDPEPTPISPPPMETTRAPTLLSELSQTLLPEILMPLSALITSQTRTMSLVPAPAPLTPRTSATSLVLTPAPTAPQISAASSVPAQDSITEFQISAASFVPTLTSILSQIQISSLIPAASLERAKASKSTQILAASLVPTQVSPFSSLVSSPKFLDASLVPTQTSQLIQTLTPSLVPIQTSVSFLPLTMPKKHPSTTPALFPVLPQNPAVNVMPTQVSKLSQTLSAPVVHTATPTLSPVAPHRRAMLLVPAETLLSPLTLAQIPTQLLQLPRILPLSLVSGKAQNQPPQALGPTQTLTPSTTVPQKQYQLLSSTDIPTWILVPPPEFTIPLVPPPEPPTKLYSPSPELTEVLLPPQELKQVPVSVLSSESIWTPTMLLNNTFPSPSVERHLAHTTVPSSLVSQKSVGEINFLCLGPCTCKAGMLSCTGLSPELRLHSVPVPGPEAHNLTFFFLDFHGNSISIIERGTWKSYPWAETLNLKDNALNELHKNSFEGLLSLQYLDLSCNKIHVIERFAFEPLPFLQFLNLGCNLLKKLSYGTFQAWHGMQFLQKLILSHNPLSAIEDSFFFQLSSLKYLDIGRTEVPLMTIEHILVMALRLQTLVLPSHIACCLCQFKNNIESTFKTINLQCESKCFTNSSLCDQKESIDHIQEEFINTLQFRKKNTSNEPGLQPERAYVDNDINTLTLLNEQLNSNGEIDLLDAAKYLFPKLLRGQGKNVELKLFPFINTQLRNGEKTSGPSTTKTSWSSFGPIRINLTDEIELRKLYFVINLLEVYLREKMYYIKNKNEKIVKSRYPPLQNKWKTFHLERSRKCGDAPGKCSQPQASSSRKAAAPGVDTCKEQFCAKIKLGEVGKVNNRGKSMKNGESIQGKQESVKSSLENLAKGKTRVSGKAMRKLKKPSWHHVGTPSTANLLATSSEDRNKLDDLPYPISALKNVNKRLKYKGQKEKHRIGTAFQKDHIPILHSNNHLFHKAKLHVANKFPEAKQSQKMKNILSKNRWLPENSVFTETRSLIKNPSKKAISFSPERSISAKASKRTTPAKTSERPSTRSTTLENTTASSKQMEEFTLDNSLPADQKTNETHWKYQGNAKFPPEPNGNSSFNLSASADLFEMELNHQLQPLIPNDAMRNLISHIVQTLQKDCTEPRVQLACAKLISRTGHLMKLFSEREKKKQSSAHHNSDSQKHETNLSDSTTLKMVLGQLQTDELTKDIAECGYNNKLLLAISVTVVVMIIIAVICLIEICSHRPTTSKDETKHSCNLWNFITSLQKKSSRKNHKEDGNLYKKGKPLWLRDMYRPLDATRKKNMAQKLRDQDSSDEEEIFEKEER